MDLSARVPPSVAHVDPRADPAYVLGATRFGALFRRSRWWAQRVFRSWWLEQANGGPVRVFRRGNGRYYTTMAIVDAHLPRRTSDASERRLRALERDVDLTMARVAELERRLALNCAPR